MLLKQILKLTILAILTGFILNGLYQGYKAIKIIEAPEVQATTIPYTEIEAITSKYTAVETCPNTECVTASGDKPIAGITIACPREIALGTDVEIQGKMYKCQDRTALKHNGRYDIFEGYTVEDWQNAKEYGLQQHLIKIYY